tara:strand:+ start:148 stop:912 length:765 start_codon:yes stop_codon:yes gene_type:complete
MQSSVQMSNQVYLVTGASKGLGRSICELLANNGYIVIGLARNSSDLSSLDSLLKGFNPKSLTIRCDLSNPSEVSLAGKQIAERYSSVHGIIHNAGIISPIGSMFDVDSSVWDQTIMVNLLSVQHLTKALHASMVNAQRCRVTTISSGAAINSLESWSAYCTSKAGLEMWTKCLADEGSRDGISAISIAPGIVDTDMQVKIRSVTQEDFPMVDRFIEFHKNGDLVSPNLVAEALFNLITCHTMEQSGERFDVREL